MLGLLPGGRGEGLHFRHLSADLYLLQPEAGPLHRWSVRTVGDHFCFLQGEFYAAPDLDALAKALVEGRLDQRRLDAALRELNGTFSGFVLDAARCELHGFTDRFGFARLYLAGRGGALAASSSLWPFTADEALRGPLDPDAFADILISGFPWFDRTAYSGVRTVLPGAVAHVSAAGFSAHDYDPRRRTGGQDDPVRERRRFREASREHFAHVRSRSGDGPPALALSGGHDSRVVLNAMLVSAIRPVCYIGYDYRPTWDSRRALRVATTAGCPVELFDYQRIDPQDWIDANVLADGTGTASWSMNLARQAARRTDCLYFGTSGDLLSGGWGVLPHLHDDLDTLAASTFGTYFYEYRSPPDDFLTILRGRDRAWLAARFRRTFEGLGGDLAEAFLAHRIILRNFRRIRMFMQGAYLYAAPVHFFHDNRIVDFYWNLAYGELVWQRAHARLCSLAVRRHALIPATNYLLPVAWEPWLLPVLKTLVPDTARARLRRLTRHTPGIPDLRDSPALARLRDRADTLGLDGEALRRFLSREPRAGLLHLRMKYAASLLDPSDLCAGSSLIRQRRPVEAAVPAAGAP